jgi:uncharacterized NAD(P)/FAD-binding protein YdhS
MAAKPSASDFYVIVIGSGMGGMTTAAALPRDASKVGNRPIVLKNSANHHGSGVSEVTARQATG